MTLGQRIKNARIEKGMTQKQLVGDHITRNMLSKIENDSATPSVRTLEYLARKLELPVSYFVADSIFSDGSSPDGLDEMRTAYKEGRYIDCLNLLEKNSEASSTDEGYLLRARSALGAAHNALLEGDVEAAKEYADSADYYNKQGMYYSAAVDAEMSLLLAECALKLDISEFEYNAGEYERAVREISFSDRYALDRGEYLIRTGDPEGAAELLDSVKPIDKTMEARLYYLQGICLIASERYTEALEPLKQAEELIQTPELDRALEQCYLELNNYRMAYYYAARQLGEK
jgi:transcriptional regulator with XRE-family HTH domain